MSREPEPIIRKIEWRSQAKPGKVVVAIDQKTGKAVADTGLIGLARNLLHRVVLYEITVDERHWIENARAAIAVFLTNERSELAFRMRVRAPRADATAVAEALHDHELSPAQVLFKVVRTHLGALLERSSREGPESVVERIASNREVWQTEIERVVAARLHLDAEIIFELPPRRFIDTDVSVRTSAIQVSPRDAPHATFPITVSIVLERTQSRAKDPLPRSEEERQRLVQDVVSKSFRDRISLFVYWFQPAALADELAASLSEALVRYAYVLKTLTVDPIEPPVAAEEQIVGEVSWSGRLARSIPFHIESKIRMTPTGAGAYHARGLPDRRDWIKGEVQAALKSAMHGRDFIDLTPEAEREVHNTVHLRLNELARMIGHEVDTFVASAAIPEKIWLEPVTVEVGRREYKTNNDLVPAEFEISLVVRMTTLARLERIIQAHRATFLRTDDGANAAIRSAIVESATRAAARVMSEIMPADYFSKYERWEVPASDDEPVGQRNYVRNQLIRAIQAELKAAFHIASCEVNLRRVDSRVAAIIKQIQSIGDIEVSLAVEPQHSSGPHEAATISLLYFIGSVAPDEWANVIQRGANAFATERLANDLANWSREALADRTLDELYGLALRRNDNVIVRQEIEAFVAQRVSYHYGATIGIKAISSTYNKADSLARDIRALDVEREAVRVEKFRSYLDEFAKERDDLGRREYLRRRRETLQLLIINNERKSDEDHVRLEQHEAELRKVQGELEAANRTTVSGSFLRLTASEDRGKSKAGEPRPDEPNDVVTGFSGSENGSRGDSGSAGSSEAALEASVHRASGLLLDASDPSHVIALLEGGVSSLRERKLALIMVSRLVRRSRDAKASICALDTILARMSRHGEMAPLRPLLLREIARLYKEQDMFESWQSYQLGAATEAMYSRQYSVSARCLEELEESLAAPGSG